MKLKYLMLPLILGATALTATAQNEPYKTAFRKDAGANWFVTVQGGASAMFLHGNDNVSLSDKLTLTPSIAVGKWYNPNFATRLKVVGGKTSTFAGEKGAVKHTNSFVGAHYDFLFDVVNYFSSYRPDRLFHLTPYLGAGYEYKFDSSVKDEKNVHALTANAGLQLDFRVSKRFDVILEGEATFNNINLSTPYLGFSNEFRTTLSAGLNIRLGRTDFVVSKPQDDNLVKGLHSQINALRAENAELSKRPERCPEVAEVAPVVVANHFLAEKSILFKHGKKEVSNDQLITVFDAAQFVLDNKGEIEVVGYTQKSESRFKGLAQKRAQEVARILSEKYQVPAEKISVSWKDASEAQPHESAAWNRVVIIRSK